MAAKPPGKPSKVDATAGMMSGLEKDISVSKLDDQTKEFLLEEFKTSWDQLFNIDNRRGVFFNYLQAVLAALLVFAANVLGKAERVTFVAACSFTVGLLMVIVVALAIRQVLESERRANVRYRKKINLIREIFLKESEDSRIKMYLNPGENLGIKLFSVEGDRNKIDAVGGTLKPIFQVIDVEVFVCAILIPAVWAGYWYSSVR